MNCPGEIWGLGCPRVIIPSHLPTEELLHISPYESYIWKNFIYQKKKRIIKNNLFPRSYVRDLSNCQSKLLMGVVPLPLDPVPPLWKSGYSFLWCLEEWQCLTHLHGPADAQVKIPRLVTIARCRILHGFLLRSRVSGALTLSVFLKCCFLSLPFMPGDAKNGIPHSGRAGRARGLS